MYRLRLQGAQGIMRAFLQDFLDSLDEADRLEALELLEPLITGSGTRNIVERDGLVTAPFRPRRRREELLGKLVGRTIVRVETRLGGHFVEITHEFLIPPIRDAMQKELYADVNFTRCRLALRTLGRLQERHDPREAEKSMTRTDFQLLGAYRDRIAWNAWGIEVMLRLATRLGAQHDYTRHWAERLERHASTQTSVDEGGSDARHDEERPSAMTAALTATTPIPAPSTVEPVTR